MRHPMWLILVLVVNVVSVSASVFVYAPGVSPVLGNTPEKAIKDVCRAAYNLHIFSRDAELVTSVNMSARIATVTDVNCSHIIYIPLFIDFYPETGIADRYIAQGRDIADLFYVHYYAVLRHEGPIHCIGHSRGAGTIAVYAGLIWYDMEYLMQLARLYWPASYLPAEDESSEYIGEIVADHLGVICLMGAFDNLAETLHNIIASLPVPNYLYRKLSHDLRYVYQRVSKYVRVPYYDWDSVITPRNMISYVPADIPCICVHTDNDPINPANVARDIYAIRQQIAPDCSTLHILSNTMKFLPFRHIEVPYLREAREVSQSLFQYISQIDLHFSQVYDCASL